MLNFELYNLLQRRVGGVVVKREGQRIDGYYYDDDAEIDGKRVKRVRFRVRELGEVYSVHCPICLWDGHVDRRRRCDISYRFGEYDPRTASLGLELWKCFNSECQRIYANRKRLYDWIYSYRSNDRPLFDDSVPMPVNRSRTNWGAGIGPVSFPGNSTPLSRLPQTHRVRAYLKNRDFDASSIDGVWGASVLDDVTDPDYESADRRIILRGRIVVPVFLDGTMVAWQARFPGNAKAARVPKYFNMYGMPKKSLLYGVDQAQGRSSVIIVEGITDVWRAGPCAVATFGKGLSEGQASLLARKCPEASVVVVVDNDSADDSAEQKARESLVRLKEVGLTPAIATLPKGLDPGKCPRLDLLDFASACAESQGVHAEF